MNEPNDPKLMLAMAKLLPEQIEIRSNHFAWLSGLTPEWRNGEVIHDTEWLYIMHLVESTMTGDETLKYNDALNAQTKYLRHITPAIMAMATFNQRARAMCALKGITI